jgi:hypothetical protein
MPSPKGTRLAQNPLCLACFVEMVPRYTEAGLVCFEAKSGKPHTCGRYLNGQYRPAGDARIYHKARLLALEDDPRQVEAPGGRK